MTGDRSDCEVRADGGGKRDGPDGESASHADSEPDTFFEDFPDPVARYAIRDGSPVIQTASAYLRL